MINIEKQEGKLFINGEKHIVEFINSTIIRSVGSMLLVPHIIGIKMYTTVEDPHTLEVDKNYGLDAVEYRISNKYNRYDLLPNSLKVQDIIEMLYNLKFPNGNKVFTYMTDNQGNIDLTKPIGTDLEKSCSEELIVKSVSKNTIIEVVVYGSTGIRKELINRRTINEEFMLSKSDDFIPVNSKHLKDKVLKGDIEFNGINYTLTIDLSDVKDVENLSKSLRSYMEVLEEIIQESQK